MFTALITTFDRPDIVGRAVQSCLDQNRQDLEVIVCDDGSNKDYSAAMAAFTDPRVRYIRLPQNGGKIAAIIAGAEAAKGRFVAFLDDDDEWAPDHLENLAAAIEKSGPAADSTLFYTRVRIITQNGERVRPATAKAEDQTFIDYIINGRGLIQNSGICLPSRLLADFKLDPSIRKHVDYELCQWAEFLGAEFRLAEASTAIWHCEHEHGRLSKTRLDASSAWLAHWESRGVRLPQASKLGFVAFHVAPLAARTSPGHALRLLLDAARKGYFSPSLTVRTMRNALTALNGAA
jgi:glycosyltransferase involved in cell wall biosynthesis